MKRLLLVVIIVLATQTFLVRCNGQNITNQSLNNITELNKKNIESANKRTETPFSGIYDNFFEEGYYVCHQCKKPLYKSSSKFDAHCGWPAFDDEIKGAIKRIPDGNRTEIVCSNCNSHLGHVFLNEGFTSTNTRHCVNSYSMEFISKTIKTTVLEKAYFAEGCFWGAEYWMEKQIGVKSAISGYAGGTVKNPSYYQVSSGSSGHVETVEVLFNPEIISYEELVKVFFNTHDFSQTDGQGPDIGSQYHSVIFYISKEQKLIAEKYKKRLINKGNKVATRIEKASKFYPAEMYHQDYYEHKGTQPYCHIYKNKF